MLCHHSTQRCCSYPQPWRQPALVAPGWQRQPEWPIWRCRILVGVLIVNNAAPLNRKLILIRLTLHSPTAAPQHDFCGAVHSAIICCDCGHGSDVYLSICHQTLVGGGDGPPEPHGGGCLDHAVNISYPLSYMSLHHKTYGPLIEGINEIGSTYAILTLCTLF